MLLTPPRSRWAVIVAAIFVAELAVDLYYGVGVRSASGFALANSVEPAVGASLVWAWCKGAPDLSCAGVWSKFVAAACLAGPLVGGSIGGVGQRRVQRRLMAHRRLCTGGPATGIGALVVAAPILLWPRAVSPIARGASRRQQLVLSLVTAALSLTALWWHAPPTLLLLPVMAWAAFRLDVIGAALAGAALAYTSSTTRPASGRGPVRGTALSPPRPGSR